MGASIGQENVGEINFINVKNAENTENITQVENLAQEIWRQHYSSILDAGQIEFMLLHLQSAAAIVSQIEQGYRYYLIQYDGVAVGYFSFKPEQDNKKVFISKLYIQKSMRGKGIFNIVLKFIQQQAIKLNLLCLYLTVNKNNKDSIKIYQKKGFDIVKEALSDIGNGYFMDDYVMEKIIVP